MKKILRSFKLRDVMLLAVLSAAMIFGMSKYVSPLDKAKEAALEELAAYPIDEYMEDDRDAINEFRNTFREPIEKADSIPAAEAVIDEFAAALPEHFKTRSDEIGVYDVMLKDQIEDIYSDKDREEANALASEFDEEAKSAATRDDMDQMYTSVKMRISAYKTKEQYKREQAIINYLIGTWAPNKKNEYSFTLRGDNSFSMPIARETTTISGLNTDILEEYGSLYGSWSYDQSNKVVSIYIQGSTLDSNYSPYTWTFNYNTDDKVLEGTGSYSGWTYSRVS